jgi:hypothetical protein
VVEVGERRVRVPAPDAPGEVGHGRLPAGVSGREEGGEFFHARGFRGPAAGAAERGQHGPAGRQRDQRRHPGHALGGHGHFLQHGRVGDRGAPAPPGLHAQAAGRDRWRRGQGPDCLGARHRQPPLPPGQFFLTLQILSMANFFITFLSMYLYLICTQRSSFLHTKIPIRSYKFSPILS